VSFRSAWRIAPGSNRFFIGKFDACRSAGASLPSATEPLMQGAPAYLVRSFLTVWTS
jgi:hypothetical protein